MVANIDITSKATMMKKALLVAHLPPPYGGISHWTTVVVKHSRVVDRILRYAPRIFSAALNIGTQRATSICL